MPELLTRRETPQSVVGSVAGFKSESALCDGPSAVLTMDRLTGALN